MAKWIWLAALVSAAVGCTSGVVHTTDDAGRDSGRDPEAGVSDLIYCEFYCTAYCDYTSSPTPATARASCASNRQPGSLQARCDRCHPVCSVPRRTVPICDTAQYCGLICTN